MDVCEYCDEIGVIWDRVGEVDEASANEFDARLKCSGI